MRLCCFGDIHYSGFRARLRELEASVKDTCPDVDVVVITGDISAMGRLEYVEEVLLTIRSVFDKTPILVVPGNHDIYVMPDEASGSINSLLKLSLFNNLVERLGCIPLMKEPYIVDGVGFIGNIGWYD